MSRRSSRPPPVGKLVLRSKAAQLADYLRACIREGRLAEPLPGTRAWSQQLGVSRRTLHATIKELQRQGWLTVRRQGMRLNPLPRGAGRAADSAPPVVRLLLYDAYRRQIYNNLETYSALRERLQLHGIDLNIEVCPPNRLQKIVRQPSPPNELLILASLPPAYQRRFAEAGKPAVVLGEVAAGVPLPFINVDQAAAVRHATFHLLRHGLEHVELVHGKLDAAGIKSSLAAFRKACAEWTRHRATAKLVATGLDQPALMAAMRRLATGVEGRRGYIVLAPVPIGLVVTALLQHGVAVPQQAEVVAVFHSPEALKLYPPPAHYPSPVNRLVQHLADAAVSYFATHRLPDLKKTLAVELADHA